MRFVSLASGSSGNSTYIGTDHTHILVDAGISCRRIDTALKELGIKSNELNGIFITHEHSDHIQGLRMLSKKYHVPIYGTEETLQQIEHIDKKGEIDTALFRSILPDVPLEIGDMTVHPFANSHDAANPLAYRVESCGKSTAVVTDLGGYSDYTIQNLENVDVILLEANHDIHMLETGSYPYYLKRRILSSMGHLSNDACGELLNSIVHDGIKNIFLGHLSKENNMEELAYETVSLAITMGENPYRGNDFKIQVAKRDKMSEIVYL